MFTVILILTGLWLANDTFDFIHSFRTSYKLEHLEKITLLLNDTTLSSNQRQHLLADRDYIIRNRSKLDYLSCLLDSFSFHTSRTNRVIDTIRPTISADTIKPSKSDDSKTVNSSVPIKNYWWHFVFSNMFLLGLIIAIPLFAFKGSPQPFLILAVSTIVMWAGIILIAIGCAYVLDFIPVLWGRPWINYVLDFFIQSVFWTSIFYYIGTRPKKS